MRCGNDCVGTKRHLERIERDLTGIAAAITQVTGRRGRHAGRIAQIATGKAAGAAAIGGVMMFITAFGSASTGTAIGALSGAAATSAKLYFIGSLFGLGAAAGAVILPAAGAVLGLIAVFFLRRAVLGRPRKIEAMEEFEVRALYASLQLAEAAKATLAREGTEPSSDELRIYALEGLSPLCDLIAIRLQSPASGTEKEKRCQSFGETLALLPRWKLRRHHRRLSRRAAKLGRRRGQIGLPAWLPWLSRSRFSG